MKRKMNLILALLMVFALLLPMAACGGKEKDAGATDADLPSWTEEETWPEEPSLGETETEAETGASGESESETEAESGTEAVSDSQSATADGTTGTVGTDATLAATTAAPASVVPSTPAEVLAAYTEVMNKAKNEAKLMRKLEYQFLDMDQMKFETEQINSTGFLNFVNKNLLTLPDDARTKDQYTKGVTDMYENLPVMHTPVGCMVKDPSVFSKATAKQLPNGNIELTLVMKPEDNPEPAKEGATTSPSVTGQMFNPLSKAGVDDLIKKVGIFITTKLVFSIRYYDCKSVLVYNPNTKQIVSLNQNYYVLISVFEGKVVFINAKGTGVLEAATICDNFKY